MAKQNVTVELYYSGAWHPVPVYTRDPVTITRGRAEGAQQITASTAGLAIDDRAQMYNPRNPRGPLFGLIGRNTPIRITVDADPRFYGEVSSWQPRRTVDFDPATGRGDAWVTIEAAGILRRLAQGEDPLDSAARRAILAVGPEAYWPLEDGEHATAGASAVPGVPDMRPAGVKRFPSLPPAGLPKFAAGTGPAGSKPLASLTEGGMLTGRPPVAGFDPATGWELHWTMRLASGAYAGATGHNPFYWRTGTGLDWLVEITNTTVTVLFDGPTLTSGAASITAPMNLFDGIAHHYAVWAYQAGTDIITALYIDDEFIGQGWDDGAPGTGAIVGTLPPVDTIIVNPFEAVGDDMPTAIGHVAYFAPLLGGGDSTAVATAVHGHVGEAAGRRIERLCAEQGVAFGAVGDLDATAPMGAQRPDTLTALLAEAERTDDGLLVDPVGWLGLTYRTREALENQAPTLTLDFAAFQVAPPLEPDVGDLGVFNDVTVKSPDGASARAVRDTGPLNTSSPQADPQGIGRVPTSIEVNPADNADLADHAGWHLHTSTVDETRYPRVTAYLDATPAVAADAAAVTPGDVLAVVGLEPDTVTQLVSQIVETVESHRRTITYGGIPASPYTVATADGAPRVPADGSTLAAPLTAGAMAFSLASIGGLWTTDPADFPQDLMVGGERVTVSAIAGTSSPQTAIVTARAVNGVSRSWPAGTPVDVLLPAVAPL